MTPFHMPGEATEEVSVYLVPIRDPFESSTNTLLQFITIIHIAFTSEVFTRFSLWWQDGTAGPVSLDQILGRERGQGNIHFPRSADHEQVWQPYPVDPYPCYI